MTGAYSQCAVFPGVASFTCRSLLRGASGNRIFWPGEYAPPPICGRRTSIFGFIFRYQFLAEWHSEITPQRKAGFSELFGNSCSAAPFGRIKSRRAPDSQSGMLPSEHLLLGISRPSLLALFRCPFSTRRAKKKRENILSVSFPFLCAIQPVCWACRR